MNPLFHTEFSISDSLKNVRKSVLIYETIIELEFQYISCCSLSAGKSADEIAKENFNTSHVVVYHLFRLFDNFVFEISIHLML